MGRGIPHDSVYFLFVCTLFLKLRDRVGVTPKKETLGAARPLPSPFVTPLVVIPQNPNLSYGTDHGDLSGSHLLNKLRNTMKTDLSNCLHVQDLQM
ncbi:hypothetical protein J6590_029170, partial [Homalodisca vitripennis]